MSNRNLVSFIFAMAGYVTILFPSMLSCKVQHQETAMDAPGGNSALFSAEIPDHLTNSDTSPGWTDSESKILITGTVFKMDGKTPAANILLHYYQANGKGKSVHHAVNDVNSRGWLKTTDNGKYSIYTIRPEADPTKDEPAHIHITVKEPDIKEDYYLDDFVFDDDQFLTSIKRKRMENRGGTGVLRLVEQNGLYVGERNIILGLNIPDYPKQQDHQVTSGKKIGEDVFSFTPFHAWGPDKGSKTCPICKYGWYLGILYFVGNHPNWPEVEQWLVFLESESVKREKYLKVYFVYGNEIQYNPQDRTLQLAQLGNMLGLKKVALTFVPSFSDKESEINLNLIDPEVQNTFLIYKRSTVVENLVDLKPTSQNFKAISKRLDEVINEYFDLPRPKYGED